MNEIIIKMGIWTTNNGNKHNVNIKSTLVSAMRAKGARFCWLNDNPGINDKNNNTYYQSVTEDETSRCLRQDITVVCEDGETLTGYVNHLVRGSAAGTNISSWFIFQPGSYPTNYHIQHSVDKNDIYVEEL